ncbi:monocarboxylate transporter, putative, partial [Ixodes scapularis]
RVVNLLLRLPIYYVVTLSWLILCYNVDIFTTTLIDYAIDKGVSATDSLSLVSYSFIAEILGRILVPLFADRNYFRRSTLSACNFFMMGAAVTCLSFVSSYVAFVGVTVAVSCFMGSAVSTCSALLADNVGLEKLEVSYGLMGLLCAPLLFAKPFFVGFFRDKLGAYDNMYHIFSGLLFFLSLLWSLIVITERRMSKCFTL